VEWCHQAPKLLAVSIVEDEGEGECLEAFCGGNWAGFVRGFPMSA